MKEVFLVSVADDPAECNERLEGDLLVRNMEFGEEDDALSRSSRLACLTSSAWRFCFLEKEEYLLPILPY